MTVSEAYSLFVSEGYGVSGKCGLDVRDLLVGLAAL